MATHDTPIRDHSFADLSVLAPETEGTQRRWLARAQNFSVEWIEFGDARSAEFAFDSEFETLLLAVRGSLQLGETQMPADAFAIVPAGRHVVRGEANGAALVIASQRGDASGRTVINAQAYAHPDTRIVPSGRPFRRKTPLTAPQVLPIAAIMASPDKPRLKMLQTETLSINIVDYQGARDRTQLSPHSHREFEQGSFAVHGNYIHHLRTPWAPNADLWREDQHVQAPSPSLVVVPVELIHTTEGVGEGRHLLLDLFSPPRFDFIGNGWVFNAGDYEPQAE